MNAEPRFLPAEIRKKSSRDLRIAEIELRANLGTRERDWILGRLMSQSGVEDASWGDMHAPSLLVEYDAELVTGAELVNFLYLCGLPAPE